jgi:hypothetical protein
MVSVPLRAPADAGMKPTLMVQLEPEATGDVVEHVPPDVGNSAEPVEMDEKDSEPPPETETVTVCGVALEPTGTAPKLRLVLDTEPTAAGAAVAVPDKVAATGPLDEATVKVAARVPVAVGAKATVTVQEPPTGMAVPTAQVPPLV